MSIFELFMCILCLFWTICHGICHETSWEPGFFGFVFCFPFPIWHLKLQGSPSFGFAARNDSKNKAAWQARQEGSVLVFLGWKEGWGTVAKPNKSAAFLQTCSSGLDYEQRMCLESQHCSEFERYRTASKWGGVDSVTHLTLGFSPVLALGNKGPKSRESFQPPAKWSIPCPGISESCSLFQ